MMKSKKGAIEIAQMYNRWIEESRLIKSPHTVDSYELTMNLYIRYIATEKSMNVKSFDAKKCFSKNIIEDWLRWLQDKGGCTPQSCNVRLSNLHSFLKYLSAEDYKYAELYLVSKTVERRKAPRVKICGMSKDGVEALLNSIDITTDVGIRDYILWELIYRTALRISEALSIKLKHINLKAEKPFVTIVGKRYKVRSAYLGKTLTENLKRYIRNNFGKKYDEDSFLFYSRIHGKKTPITVKGAELRLKKYAMLANLTCKDVPVNLHPHMLRHARATHLLESGWNIIQVSKMLGHEDVSTTMRYLDITEEQTLSAMISIESEAEKKIEKKWDSNSLLSFFGKTK